MEKLKLPESGIDWEAMWAPYDEATYWSVLENVRTEDIMLDIGAGDLRFARRMAEKCRKVYAIEIQEKLLNLPSLAVDDRMSGELIIIHEDARRAQFPRDVTAGVLLMRHCSLAGTHVGVVRWVLNPVQLKN
jgi:predicted RNA methylase